MGWTYTHRDKGTTNKEFFLKDFDHGTTFHAHGTVNGIFYAAVESPRRPGEVWALVALTNWVPSEHFNFGFKDMSEDMGPGVHRAPLSVLNALTPTDHPIALEWRERVAQHHAQRKAVRGLEDGDRVVLGTVLRFTDGSERDTFIVRRSLVRGGRTKVVLRDERGQAYRVSNWQDMTMAVIRDGERTETPLALRRKEHEYVQAVCTLQVGDSQEAQEALAARYGDVGYSDLEVAARQEFRRGDLFAFALASA